MRTIVLGNRADWLQERKKGIGASETGLVCGIEGFGTIWDVWLEKRGMRKRKPDPVVSDGIGPMEIGHILEPAVAQMFERSSGVSIKTLGDFALTWSSERDFLFCTLDYYSSECPVELKVTGAKKGADWTSTTYPYQYFCQVQHQMYVTESDHAYLAALVGGHVFNFRYYKIARDEKFIRWMNFCQDRFWECVSNGVPPRYSVNTKTVDAIDRCLGSPEIKKVELGDDAARMLKMREHYRLLAKENEDKKRIIDGRIKAMMLDANEGYVGDKLAVTWKNNKRGGRVFSCKKID